MFNTVKTFFFILAVVFAFAKSSYADWSVGIGVGGPGYHDHAYYGWHDHPGWGYHAHYLPPGAYGVWVGGTQYYYYDGLYYSYYGNGDYVIINPPIGAYVQTIPPDFQPVIINGRQYYTNGGVYYVWSPHHGAFKVVEAPVVYAQPVVTTVVSAPAPVPVAQGSFTINVPNSGGSYTPVVINRSGSGYTGPQGEYYPTFPTVAQLKAMYGK